MRAMTETPKQATPKKLCLFCGKEVRQKARSKAMYVMCKKCKDDYDKGKIERESV